MEHVSHPSLTAIRVLVADSNQMECQLLVSALRERVAGQARVSVASPRLNTDNAAMVAAAGAWRLARGERSGLDLEPRDDLPLPGLAIHFPGSKS